MTDEEALTCVNGLLEIEAVITTRGDEVKCWIYDFGGGRDKVYLGVDDCDRLGDAFRALTNRLRNPKSDPRPGVSTPQSSEE